MIHRVAASTKPVTLLDMQILGPQPRPTGSDPLGRDPALCALRSPPGDSDGPYRLRHLGLMVGLFWVKRETVFHSVHRKFPHESAIIPEAVSCVLCSSRCSGWSRAPFHQNSVGISCLDYIVGDPDRRKNDWRRENPSELPPPRPPPTAPLISVLLDWGLGAVGGAFLTVQFYHMPGGWGWGMAMGREWHWKEEGTHLCHFNLRKALLWW